MGEYKWDHNRQFEAYQGLDTLTKLIDSRILWMIVGNTTVPVYYYSVLVHTILELHHLANKADKLLRKRIAFCEDVRIDLGAGINDVTDLIRVFRDIICHSDTGKKSVVHGSRVHLGAIAPGVNSFTITFRDINLTMENKYIDDVAYIAGPFTIYLKRHIERAYRELYALFQFSLPAELLSLL